MYLINGIILGIIINLLIPVFAVPDEPVYLATALIPTLIQQAFSYNYDCIINAFAILTVALALKLRLEKKIN